MYSAAGIVCLIFTYSIDAQSIASSLAQYKKVLSTTISGITTTSISGATYHPGSKTIYVVDDADTVVFEVDTSGKLIRKILLSGFEDTEGIAYQAGDKFFIVEERRGNIVRVTIPQTGSNPVMWSNSVILNIAQNMGNTGLEDVAYVSPDKVYAVKEMSPARMYTVQLDNSGNPVSFIADSPFNIGGFSGDAAGLYALADGNFLILNQEENKCIGYNSQGVKLSELPTAMTKPEGLTVNSSDGIIYVVGEPREFSVFKNTVSSILVAYPHYGAAITLCRISREKVVIEYSVTADIFISIDLFTIQGKRIKSLLNKKCSAGTYHIADKIPYSAHTACIVRLNAGNDIVIKKLVLL
jgi:uncharacterized protein YjiK